MTPRSAPEDEAPVPLPGPAGGRANAGEREDGGPARGGGLLVLCASAFIFGLDLGWPSVGALLAAVAWQLLFPRPLPGPGRAGVLGAVLLVATVVSYYAIAVAHGQYEPLRALGYVMVCLAAYAAGLTASGARDADLLPNVLVAFVFAALGSTGYAWLSARQGLEVGAELALRSAPSAWNPADLMTATALGAAAAPGLALLAAVVFSVREDRSRIWRLAAWPAAAAGLVANALLLNRSPFLALALALVACGWIFLRARGVEGWRKPARLALLVGVALAAGAVAWSQLGEGEATIVARFETEGVSTARWELMWEVLSQLFQHPLGGRAFPISENFAHNLWLDVGYDAGPLPFLLLLAFHAAHLPSILAVLQRHPSLNARLVTAAALASFAFTAMAEPVLIMSVPHFSLGLFLLGGLLRVAAALPAAAPAGEPLEAPPETGAG